MQHATSEAHQLSSAVVSNLVRVFSALPSVTAPCPGGLVFKKLQPGNTVEAVFINSEDITLSVLRDDMDDTLFNFSEQELGLSARHYLTVKTPFGEYVFADGGEVVVAPEGDLSASFVLGVDHATEFNDEAPEQHERDVHITENVSALVGLWALPKPITEDVDVVIRAVYSNNADTRDSIIAGLTTAVAQKDPDSDNEMVTNVFVETLDERFESNTPGHARHCNYVGFRRFSEYTEFALPSDALERADYLVPKLVVAAQRYTELAAKVKPHQQAASRANRAHGFKNLVGNLGALMTSMESAQDLSTALKSGTLETEIERVRSEINQEAPSLEPNNKKGRNKKGRKQ